MKFVVVDDHPVYRDGLAALLGQLFAGAQVMQAGDAGAAFALLAQHAAVDLVLLDLAIPGLDGRAALPVLRARFPAVPVVVVSASDDDVTAADCIVQGASGFITKSARREALEAALRAVVDGGVVLSRTATRGATRAPGLTPRELEVLRRLGAGDSNKLIARQLDMAEATVRVHLTAVFRELGVTSRTQALLEARRRGLLPD